MLSSADGDLVIKPCTPAEVEFYKACAERNEPLLQFLPKFMGTLQLATLEQKEALEQQSSSPLDGTAASFSPDHVGPMKGKKLQTEQAIVLENASAGFIKPNVLDLKLGARLWDDDAPPAKRQRLDDVASKTTSGSLGFRIAGMRIWNNDTNDYKSYDKLYGRQFDANTVNKGFETYFGLEGARDEPSDELLGVVQLVQKEVQDIRAALEVMELRMYSASILIVYEGHGHTLRERYHKLARPDSPEAEEGDDDGGDSDGSDEDEDTKPIYRVVMIDFAHASFTPGQGQDQNVLKGVDSVLNVFEKLVTDGP